LPARRAIHWHAITDFFVAKEPIGAIAIGSAGGANRSAACAAVRSRQSGVGVGIPNTGALTAGGTGA
jgi:hypothetical protein